MARIRTIKPEFFTSESIVSLSPFARLLYIALWCEADREGRMKWKPNTFKMRYLPADNVDISELCEELIQAGVVVCYGDSLAYIPKFSAHQHINPRETASSLPDPLEKVTRRYASSTRAARDSDVQGGREGKGKEVNPIVGLPDEGQQKFILFWKSWPASQRKVAKAECQKKWRSMKLDPLAEQIIAHVEAMKLKKQWRDGYEPAPLTYLNQRRWEDGTDESAAHAHADIFAGVE